VSLHFKIQNYYNEAMKQRCTRTVAVKQCTPSTSTDGPHIVKISTLMQVNWRLTVRELAKIVV